MVRVELDGASGTRWCEWNWRCEHPGAGCELLVAVDDASSGQVVRRELDHHAVLGEDPDVVLTHLAADVREDPVPVLQLHAKHRVGERLDDPALDLDGPVLLRHVLRCPTNLLSGNRVRTPEKAPVSGTRLTSY